MIKSRERLLTVGAVVCVLALAGDKVLVSPLQGLWKARQESIAELNESLAKGRALVEREKTLREMWGEMEAACLPASASEAQNLVLKSVDRWARESGLALTAQNPRWKREDEGLAKLEFRADARGPLESIARFLYGLETDALALRIEGAQIDGFNSGGDLTLRLRFSGLIPGEAKS